MDRLESIYDVCRICLALPETDTNVKFFNIFQPFDGTTTLKELMKDLLNIDAKPSDVGSQIVCEYCCKSLFHFDNIRKKAAESAIAINYLTQRKPLKLFNISMAPDENLESHFYQIFQEQQKTDVY